jgi:hypothetical protein
MLEVPEGLKHMLSPLGQLSVLHWISFGSRYYLYCIGLAIAQAF